MATNFPTSLQDLDATRGSASDTTAAVDHTVHHTLEDDTIEALQAKVGVDNSAVTSSLDYKLTNTSSINPGHLHTLDNLSDVSTSGAVNGDFLSFNGSTWAPTTTSAPDASTTVKGVVKLDTAPASASNPIAVGDNSTRLPTQDENDALAGTSGTPSSSNKFVTNDDTASAATASKLARRNATGDVTVPTTPSASTDASSKSYVDTSVAYNHSAGTLQLAASDSEATSTDQANYQKLKEIQMSSKADGTVTVTFEGKGTGSNSGTVYARVYINGVAQGTERALTFGSYTAYSENFAINPSDLIQIYGKGIAGNVQTATVQLFKVKSSILEVTTAIL